MGPGAADGDVLPLIGPTSVVDGRYTIKREIARGGMGVVFEATHATLCSSVALKTLTPRAAEHAGKARLLREARVLASCSHPYIVRIHDAGVCGKHGPFVALEMLEGRSLESYLVARQRLDAITVARLGEQLCSAVAHVHARGLLHRDIKPSNVMIVRDEIGGFDTVKLIDFGVATVSAEQQPLEPKLTREGVLLGTVEYMAPELVCGEALASPASDVYSIGVLLHEALTGELPFPGNAVAIASAYARRLVAPPLGPPVPEILARAIASALARDPGKRMESAEAFGRACAELGGRTGLDLLNGAAPAATGSARRQFARAPYNAPTRILTRAGTVDGRTEDISEGGLLVVTGAECAEGETVTVRFPLPTSGLVLTAEGVTRWIKSQRTQRAFGIAFTSLPEEAKREIRSYVELMSRRA